MGGGWIAEKNAYNKKAKIGYATEDILWQVGNIG
jgi:hypothetical protein